VNTYYIQNGDIKKTFDTEDSEDAIIEFVNFLASLFDDGDPALIHPLTLVAENGFYEDLIEAGRLDEADEGSVMLTSNLFRCCGLDSVAQQLEELEESIDGDLRNLIDDLKEAEAEEVS